MAQLLERTGKTAQFRLGDSWTLESSCNLRYCFHREMGETGVRVSIRDRQDSRNVWSIPYLQRGSMTVDYAIISRIMDPVTRNPVIAIAGLTHYGTQAAAAFVTDQDLLDRAIRGAPAGWPGRNYEAVLETAVTNRTPNRLW